MQASPTASALSAHDVDEPSAPAPDDAPVSAAPASLPPVSNRPADAELVVSGGADPFAELTPHQVRGALHQLQHYGWNHMAENILSGFGRAGIWTLDDLVDDRRIVEAARFVLASLPFYVRWGVSFTVGEDGFEGYIQHVRDWVRSQIGEEYRGADISPIVSDLLWSEAIKDPLDALFGDLMTRVAQPFLAQLPRRVEAAHSEPHALVAAASVPQLPPPSHFDARA